MSNEPTYDYEEDKKCARCDYPSSLSHCSDVNELP
jgi:hypothetical protein